LEKYCAKRAPLVGRVEMRRNRPTKQIFRERFDLD
jgi:hypothetical protein